MHGIPLHKRLSDAGRRALACCRDYASTLMVGNVLRETLAGIWHGQALAALRAEHLAGRAGNIPACSGCALSAGVNLGGLVKTLLSGRHDDA